MSAAAGSTSGVALMGVTDGSDGGTTTSTDGSDAQTQTPGSGDSGSQDYLGRIRAGGDFAASEVTKHQSRADKVEAENRKLIEMTGGPSGPIGNLVAQGVAPETIKAVFDNYIALRSNPSTQDVVLGFEQTGRFPERGKQDAMPDDDEFLTDEQREIRELRAELTRVRQDQAGLTFSTGSAALQSHLERFASEHFLKPEEFEEMKKGMKGQVDKWRTTEQGLKLLRDMQDPSAYETVDALAWKFVPKQVRFEIGERKRLHDQKKLSAFRTDVPTDAGTTGREPPKEVTGALNALRYSKANPDKI